MEEHATRWHATIFMSQEDGATTAEARLETGIDTIHGHGVARRDPGDAEDESVGAEVAAGRALIKLGRRLLGEAEEDIAHLEGHAVAHVHE
jgi:hypothetical protein